MTLSVVDHGMTELNKLIFYSFQTFNLKSLQTHNLEREKKHFKLQAGPTYIHVSLARFFVYMNADSLSSLSKKFRRF